LEWAEEQSAKGEYTDPYVIGAVIDLRNCLDLLSREDLELVRSAFRAFITMQQKAGLPVPENKSAPGRPDVDRVLRYLDCAVIKHLHSIIEDVPVAQREVEPYDTVRGLFIEGDVLYPGSGFRRQTHVQIAVRNNACIRGLFIPQPYPAT